MKIIKGTSNKVLEIDLSTGKTNILQISTEERKKYIGGKGLGLKLLFDRLKVGIDPLSEDNIIAFMPGVYMGTGAPSSGRWSALTKSPLTGIMVSSSCGGPFGMALKTSGWDGLLLKGKAPEKSYLFINSEGVEVRDANDLWGKTTVETQETLSKSGALLAIGPAGENLVRYANVISGHRFLGRGGVGAVLGSKNIKAIVAHGGEYKIEPANKETFVKARKLANKQINSNKTTSVDYRDFGTLANVIPCNDANILPVNNFRDGSHSKHTELSGQNYREKYNSKHHTCKPCTILCGHKGDFSGDAMAIPEYESAGLLGSNLGIFDSEVVARLSKLCGDLGMDTISAGSTIGWAMEATEKKLIQSDLAFGKVDNIEQTIKNISLGKGLGEDLALGVKAVSRKYGGESFAIHAKGLEMAAYDPRGSFGQALSYSVANRGGCHLSAYVIAQEVLFKLLNPHKTLGKAAYVKFLQNIKEIIDSLHTCTFTQYAFMFEPPLVKYTPKPILALLMQYMHPIAIQLIDYSLYTKIWSAITGIKISNKEIFRAGERIYILERYMNTREGITVEDDTLPERLLKEFRKSDKKRKTIPLDKMLKSFYKMRGFDDNGIPTEKTLKRSGIEIN
ncbi:MAG: aldehyde ferredoxin oxidoreductase family protein [Bacteroidales bacterium]|nr:aldehyde ferredoxin oxidoreductase family protein [Bacteroidales bacterium]